MPFAFGRKSCERGGRAFGAIDGGRDRIDAVHHSLGVRRNHFGLRHRETESAQSLLDLVVEPRKFAVGGLFDARFDFLHALEAPVEFTLEPLEFLLRQSFDRGMQRGFGFLIARAQRLVGLRDRFVCPRGRAFTALDLHIKRLQHAHT